MPGFAPRIHVLLARKAPLGLVIRRGPSKRVATFLWNRDTDDFQLGQWLRGRIYERRSDLSPDGKHFLYFAMNGKWEGEARGAWTAISRAPYLKALALFPKGDCWHGGGLWTGNHTYWLNDGCGHSVLHDDAKFGRDMTFAPREKFGGECLGVYYPRLMRDGWKLKESPEAETTVFEKPCTEGWTLRKLAHAQIGAPAGKGCYWDEHEIVHRESGLVVPCPDWEWAEWDQARLVWASDGRLHAGQLTRRGLANETVLFDFGEMTIARIAAPY